MGKIDVLILDNLIRFHQAGLDQYRQHMSPSAQTMEEATVKVLQTMKEELEEESNAKPSL